MNIAMLHNKHAIELTKYAREKDIEHALVAVKDEQYVLYVGGIEEFRSRRLGPPGFDYVVAHIDLMAAQRR